MDDLKLVVSNNNSCVLNFVDYPILICSSLIAPSSIDNLNNDVEVLKNLQIFSPLLDEFAITQLNSDYMNDLCTLKSIVVLPINLQKLRTIFFHNRAMHNSTTYFTYTCKLSCKLNAMRKYTFADLIHEQSPLISKAFSISLSPAIANILQKDETALLQVLKLPLPLEDERESRTTQMQEREDDEDIDPPDTTATPRAKFMRDKFWNPVRPPESAKFWNPVRPPESA